MGARWLTTKTVVRVLEDLLRTCPSMTCLKALDSAIFQAQLVSLKENYRNQWGEMSLKVFCLYLAIGALSWKALETFEGPLKTQGVSERLRLVGEIMQECKILSFLDSYQHSSLETSRGWTLEPGNLEVGFWGRYITEYWGLCP